MIEHFQGSGSPDYCFSSGITSLIFDSPEEIQIQILEDLAEMVVVQVQEQPVAVVLQAMEQVHLVQRYQV